MLFSIMKDSALSAADLNHDLKLICQWAHQCKMEFNPDPTKQAIEVIFSCKKDKSIHTQLTFNGNIVVEVKEQKHLGLTLLSSFSFAKHLHEESSKTK